MKKFQFSLRSVQTVRSIHEMRAREAFSAAVHAVLLAEEKLNEIQRQELVIEGAMRDGRGSIVRPFEQVALLQEQEMLKSRRKIASEELSKASEKRETCRQAWIHARRDLKVIDNLETKARQHYRRECEVEEQKLIDDRTNATVGRETLLMS